MAKSLSFAKEITKYLRTSPCSRSFVEIESHLRNLGLVTDGDCSVGYPAKNWILWVKMSPRFAKAVNTLISAGKINARPVAALVYYVDGCVPQLKVGKANRSYKKPRWVPCELEIAK